MDLNARRDLWNMFKKYKMGRIIFISTHYMDEADILGDRIGIMAGGKVTALGSSIFLKSKLWPILQSLYYFKGSIKD